MKNIKRKTNEQSGEMTKATHKPGLKPPDSKIRNDINVMKTSQESQQECLFNIVHRKDSLKSCRGKMSKLEIMKSVFRRGNNVSEGMDVKEFKKNIALTNERATTIGEMVSNIEDFNHRYANFAQNFMLSINNLLDLEVILSSDTRRQQEVMYFLQKNVEKLKLVHPIIQRHFKVIQMLVNDCCRVEERLNTFVKAIYQLNSGFSHINITRFEGLLKDD